MTSTRFTLFLFLPLLACEASPEGARQTKIAAEGEAFLYEAPPARTYEMARELLAEKGHPLPPGPLVWDRNIESGWSRDGHQFVIRFINVDASHYLVHIIGQGRNEEGTIYSRLRWHELEWELIQRAEPTRAIAIARAAGKYADDIHRRNARRQ